MAAPTSTAGPTLDLRWCKVVVNNPNSNNVQNSAIPRPRHGHRAVAAGDMMIVFGGGNEGIVEEMHVFRVGQNTWTQVNMKGEVPPGCAAYGFCTDGARCFAFGGMIEYGKYSNDLYEMKINTWEWKKIKPRPAKNAEPFPKPRLGHSFTLVENKIYMFGGLANDADTPKQNLPKYLNDLYVLEVKSHPVMWQWEVPQVCGMPPSPRESHTAVGFTPKSALGESPPKLLIYGGMSGYRLGDLWILDIGAMRWYQVNFRDHNVPLPRSLHTATVIGNKMYVFGGWVPLSCDTKTSAQEKEWRCTNTLGVLNLDNLVWEHISTDSVDDSCPRARAGHSAVAINDRLYVWSGRDGYRKAWNNQVCCKDFWYLETSRPEPPNRIHLSKATCNSFEINFNQIHNADYYILQICKFDPIESEPSAPKKPCISNSFTQNVPTLDVKKETPPEKKPIITPIVSTIAVTTKSITPITVVATPTSTITSPKPVVVTVAPNNINATTATTTPSIVTLVSKVATPNTSTTQLKIAVNAKKPAVTLASGTGASVVATSTPSVLFVTPGQTLKPTTTVAVNIGTPKVIRVVSGSVAPSVTGTPTTIKLSASQFLGGSAVSGNKMHLVKTSTGVLKLVPTAQVNPVASTGTSSNAANITATSIPANAIKIAQAKPGMIKIISTSKAVASTNNVIAVTTTTASSGSTTPMVITVSSTGAATPSTGSKVATYTLSNTARLSPRMMVVPNQLQLAGNKQIVLRSATPGQTLGPRLQFAAAGTLQGGPRRIVLRLGTPSNGPTAAVTSTSNILTGTIINAIATSVTSASSQPNSVDATAKIPQTDGPEDELPTSSDIPDTNTTSGPKWFDIGLFKTCRISVSGYYIPVALDDFDPERDMDTYNRPVYTTHEYLKKSLEPGTTYRIRVAGINALGRGPWSALSTTLKTSMPGFPPAPANIKITKMPDGGASIGWSMQSVALDDVQEYSVFLAVKGANPPAASPGKPVPLGFCKIYCGQSNSCTISAANLASAHLEVHQGKQTIIFRIAARNSKGYGPATQVRWLQDGKSASNSTPIVPNGNTSNTSRKRPAEE